MDGIAKIEYIEAAGIVLVAYKGNLLVLTKNGYFLVPNPAIDKNQPGGAAKSINILDERGQVLPLNDIYNLAISRDKDSL